MEQSRGKRSSMAPGAESIDAPSSARLGRACLGLAPRVPACRLGAAAPPPPPPPKATFKLSQWLALAACGLSGPSERSSQRQAGRPPAASLEQAGWTWVLYRASSGYLRYCTSREVVAQSPAGRAENCCLSLSRQPRVRPSTIAQCRPRARIASRPCCPPPSPRQSARSRAVNHEHGRRRRARPRPGLDRRRRLVGAVHAHPRETPRGAYYLPTYLPTCLLFSSCAFVRLRVHEAYSRRVCATVKNYSRHCHGHYYYYYRHPS